jgi:hypothetical protein
MMFWEEPELPTTLNKKNRSSQRVSIKNSIMRRLKSISDLIHTSETYLSSGNPEFADDTCIKLVEEGIKLSDGIKRYAGAVGTDVSPDGGNISHIPVTIELLENNICRIKFGSLLPHNPKRGCKLKDHNDTCASFLEGFYQEAAKMNLHYTDPVVLKFIHHYQNEGDMCDHDNYDIKPFIDAICVNFLPDDSPKWCAYYMDYVMDDENFSEIIIEKKEIFQQIMSKNCKTSLYKV